MAIEIEITSRGVWNSEILEPTIKITYRDVTGVQTKYAFGFRVDRQVQHRVWNWIIALQKILSVKSFEYVDFVFGNEVCNQDVTTNMDPGNRGGADQSAVQTLLR